MPEREFKSLKAAHAAIERDMKKRRARINVAVRKAAREVRNFVMTETVPVAFAELQHSIHAVDVGPGASDVVADAPHAAAVEVGSRPHMPPLDPIVRWVILRGIQGLSKTGRVKSNTFRLLKGRGASTYGPKDWRREASKAIATSLRSRLGRAGAEAWKATHDDTATRFNADAASIEIARAIQFKIAKEGTKPTRFMALAVPEALAILDKLVGEAMPDP